MYQDLIRAQGNSSWARFNSFAAMFVAKYLGSDEVSELMEEAAIAWLRK